MIRLRKVRGSGATARPGHVVGVVANLRRSTEPCAYGELHVLEFDLLRPHGAAPIPVRMRGMSFSRDLFVGQMVEVRDPDPETRPVVTRRLDYPPLYNTELVSFYPGEGETPRGLSRFWALVMLLVPVVIGGTLIALYDVFLRTPG
ncbi:MAG: hypothetical protein J0I21_05740 [Alphaproteobacteria bacterium]|nr:hypothetical protein [Alphaproteobacteria bacterium]